MRELERKIYFFRADVGIDGAGKPLPFEPRPVLDAIGELPFDASPLGRYELDDEGNALCAFPDLEEGTLRFSRSRRTGLPQLEAGGEIRDLRIEPEEGLLESIHVVFFPNNVIGSEYNHYGPRLSSLSYYLEAKFPGDDLGLSFRPLLRVDVPEQLRRLGEIRLLEMTIRPSAVTIASQADQSLGASFQSNLQVLGDQRTVSQQEVFLTLKPGRQGGVAALQRWLPWIRRLAQNPDFLSASDRFKVRGLCEDTGRVETIDLLKNQVVSTKAIVCNSDRSRALNSAAAFHAIREAYSDMQSDIEQAAEIVY